MWRLHPFLKSSAYMSSLERGDMVSAYHGALRRGGELRENPPSLPEGSLRTSMLPVMSSELYTPNHAHTITANPEAHEYCYYYPLNPMNSSW